MHHEQELQRFRELFQAFSDLVLERNDIQLRGSAAPPPLGFAVRLQPEPTSAGVELALSVDGGRLAKWPAEGQGNGHPPADRHMRLDLRTTFLWEGLAFPYAEQLAHTMLRWMEDQIGLHLPSRTRAEAL